MTTEFEKVTTAIRDHVGAPADPKYPDFYTPAAWRERGEEYGLTAVAIVVHDGSPYARHFNPAYHDWQALDAMIVALGDLRTPEAPRGYWSEPCTSWYTAIYRA
jgi:hypothetical protein